MMSPLKLRKCLSHSLRASSIRKHAWIIKPSIN
jgi:hypothetical protein